MSQGDVPVIQSYDSARSAHVLNPANEWSSEASAVEATRRCCAEGMDSKPLLKRVPSNDMVDLLSEKVDPIVPSDPLFCESSGSGSVGSLVVLGSHASPGREHADGVNGIVPGLTLQHGGENSHSTQHPGKALQKTNYQYEEGNGDVSYMNTTAVSSQAPEWFQKPSVTETDKQYVAGVMFTRNAHKVGAARELQPRGRRHQAIAQSAEASEDLLGHRLPWDPQGQDERQRLEVELQTEQRTRGQQHLEAARGEPPSWLLMQPRPQSAGLRKHTSYDKQGDHLHSPLTHRPLGSHSDESYKKAYHEGFVMQQSGRIMQDYKLSQHTHRKCFNHGERFSNQSDFDPVTGATRGENIQLNAFRM